MVSMKKTALAAAVLMSVGAGAVQAAPIVNFTYSGTFSMYDGFGALWGGDPALTGSMNVDLTSGGGNAAISPSTLFSGYMWTAHNIEIGMTGPGSAHAHMLFDWNTSFNIPVAVDFSMTPTAPCSGGMDCFDPGDSFAIATLDGNGDSIPGYPMVSGPFPGFNATFGGIVTVAGLDFANSLAYPAFVHAGVDYPAPSAVPVPAAVWLFGSGLLGLVGVARRKKSA